MSLQRLMHQSSNGNLDYCTGPAYSSYPTLTGNFSMDDNRRLQMLADTVATLPRGRKQLALSRSSSLGDFSWSQRKLITVEKQDNGTFGFEIQVGNFQIFQTFNEDSGARSIMIFAEKEGNQEQRMMEIVIFIQCAVVLVVLYCF